jgi:hypothetical protein
MVEHVIGHLVIGERRGGIKLNAIGQEVGRLCRRNDEFRIVAAPMRSFAGAGVHALAGASGSDLGTNLLDRTR